MDALILFSLAVWLAMPEAHARPAPTEDATPEWVRASPGEQDAVRRQVSVALMADPAGLRGGEPFRVAVHFLLPEGWHLFWENPGAGTLPPMIHLRVPTGWLLGGMTFPGPDRLHVPSGLAAYGYEGEAAIFFEVTPSPDVILRETVVLEAAATWVVCKPGVGCVAGQSEVDLELPVRTQDPSAREAVQEQLGPHLERLPYPPTGLAWTTSRRGQESIHTMVAQVEGMDFYPNTGLSRCLRSHLMTSTPVETRLELVLDGTCDAEELTGLLRLKTPEGPRFMELTIPDGVQSRGRRGSR